MNDFGGKIELFYPSQGFQHLLCNKVWILGHQIVQMVFDLFDIKNNKLSTNYKDPNWQYSEPLVAQNSEKILNGIKPRKWSSRMSNVPIGTVNAKQKYLEDK